MSTTRKRKSTVKAESEEFEFSFSDAESLYQAQSEGPDSEYEPVKMSPKKQKISEKKAKVPKPIALPSRAHIVLLAEAPKDAGNAKESAIKVSHVEQSVLDRIMKALNLANHSGTGEQEAKAALRMAHKLMSQHSVTQAAVLASLENKEERLEKAGLSAVAVRSENGKSQFMSEWSATAAHACCEFFNCKYYTTAYDERIEFSFYGLMEQTVAAAYAFEMVYNLIMTWRLSNKAAKGLHAKNSYCHGVADGLLRLARAEAKQEEKSALEKEKKRLLEAAREEEEERKRQLDRLENPKIKMEEIEDRKPKVEDVEESKVLPDIPADDNRDLNSDSDTDNNRDYTNNTNGRRRPPYDPRYGRDGYYESDWELSDMPSDSEYGSDNLLFQADFRDSDDEDLLDLDEEKPKLKVKKEPGGSTIKPKQEPFPVTINNVKKEVVEESPWETAGQLIAFRQTAEILAEDYLKEQKIKLSKGRTRQPFVFKDSAARKVYDQGREDARKIDVKRRRIKETEEDHVY